MPTTTRSPALEAIDFLPVRVTLNHDLQTRRPVAGDLHRLFGKPDRIDTYEAHGGGMTVGLTWPPLSSRVGDYPTATFTGEDWVTTLVWLEEQYANHGWPEARHH